LEGHTVTTRLREHLAAELARKVDRHGLVVWQDEAREYADVAEAVNPPNAVFQAWDGSWYELRHRVESILAGEQPPRLVIYAPVSAPGSDPLAEIRQAGTQFTLRLATLVRHALRGELSDARLSEISRQAATITEAEAVVEDGDRSDVRLVSVLGATGAVPMALAVVTGEKANAVSDAGAWKEVAAMLGQTLGGEATGEGDELRRAAVRQLILTELADRLGDLPPALAPAWEAPSTKQRRRAIELLESWRRDSRRRESYAALASEIDVELGLAENLAWAPALADCDATPAIEEMAFAESVRLLAAGRLDDALALSQRRLSSSLWARDTFPAPLTDRTLWDPRWRAVSAVASLRDEVAAQEPAAGSVASQLTWYTDRGWRVDRAHRRLELALSELHTLGDLEPEVATSRSAYERWLDQVLEHFTSALETEGLASGDLVRQGEIHPRFVAGDEGPTAYVWVDAMRYEIGTDLAQALDAVCSEVELSAAVVAPPAITPVGMANLCPGADTGLSVGLDSGEKLVVSIGAELVKGVPDRVALLRAAHGDVVDLDLNRVAQQGEKELTRTVSGARVVLVRSQEIDAAGESGMLNTAWEGFETVKTQLVSAIARLGQAGVRKVVVTADHGFIALSRGLRQDRMIDAPIGGVGVTQRRGWVGKGGTTSPSTMRVALADLGVTSDLDVIAPRSLALFRAGGTKQFFHGGLSPQELIVPLIVAAPTQAVARQKLKVHVAVAGGRISTGAFSATLGFEGDLFTTEVAVRVVARAGNEKEVVARVVSGDGYDPVSGSITIDAYSSNVLTFQITSNLGAGTEVEVQVLDARTDRLLDATTATVAAPILVEDELD
jgi:hypothetical protein